MENKRYKVLIIVVLFLFYIAINLATLCKFPALWRDDVYMSDPAWQFVQNGSFSSGIGFPEGLVIYGGIYVMSLALIFKLFGYGLYQARIVSFLSGLFATLFVYLIGKKLFDRKVGLMAAVLFILSKQFLINSHWARQEMLLTLFITIAVYLYLSARDRKSLFFFCGLVASLSADVHPNGFMLPIVFGTLFLFDYKLKIFKQTGFWFYLGGVIVGILYWLIIHIIPYPALFWQEWSILKSAYNLPLLSGKNLIGLLNWEAERYIKYFKYIWVGEKYFNILEISLFLIALIFGARRGLKSKKIILIIILTFIFSFSLLIAHKSVFYLVYLYPFFMLSIASFSYHSNSQLKILLGRVMFLSLIFIYIFQNGYRLIEFRKNNHHKYLENLKSFITPGCAVAGQPTWWYGFYNTSNKYYCLAGLPESYFFSMVKEKHIKYILFDEYWKENSYETVKDFLNNSCTLVVTLKDKFNGGDTFPYVSHPLPYTLEVYKIKDEVLNDR